MEEAHQTFPSVSPHLLSPRSRPTSPSRFSRTFAERTPFPHTDVRPSTAVLVCAATALAILVCCIVVWLLEPAPALQRNNACVDPKQAGNAGQSVVLRVLQPAWAQGQYVRARHDNGELEVSPEEPSEPWTISSSTINDWSLHRLGIVGRGTVLAPSSSSLVDGEGAAVRIASVQALPTHQGVLEWQTPCEASAQLMASVMASPTAVFLWQQHAIGECGFTPQVTASGNPTPWQWHLHSSGHISWQQETANKKGVVTVVVQAA